MSSHAEPKSGNAMGKLLIGSVVGIGLIILGMTVFKNTAPEILQGIDFNFGVTLTNMGTFLLLFPFLYMIFVKPLGAAIDERNSELERTFEEADRLRADMTTLRSDYEKRLQETEASAREQIQSEIKKAQELRAQLEADARGQAEDYKKQAIDEIDQEKHRVLSDLRLHVVNLSLGATERILGENMDTERNRKLVQEFVDRAEVPV